MTLYYQRLTSPLGELLATAGPAGLTGLYFADGRHVPAIAANWVPDSTPFDQLAVELDRYFAGALTVFSVPLAPHGTPFQRDVWRALHQIPHGTRTSYAAIAEQIGRPKAVRAVGAANGRNPLSIVVPCHRVVGMDGSLTGYAGGLERKIFLLSLEERWVPAGIARRDVLQPRLF